MIATSLPSRKNGALSASVIALGELGGAFGVAPANEDRELVSAEARSLMRAPEDPPQALGQGHEQLIPGGVPETVVHRLEVVDVEHEHDDRLAGGTCDQVIELGPEGRPVRQAGEGVVEGLMLQLLAELDQLERETRLVREGLEQLEVPLVVRAKVTDPFADQQRAEDTGVSAQRSHHGVARLGDPEEPPQPRAAPRASEQESFALADRPQDGGLGERALDGLQHFGRVARAQRRPQGLAVAVGGEQDDLGHVCAKDVACLAEQGHERLVDLRGRAHLTRRVVQELEALVLLALPDVHPVGEEQRRRRQHEQPAEGRVPPEEGHADQREARVRDRDRQPELHRGGEVLDPQLAFAQGDGQEDQHHAHDRGHGRRREDGGQIARRKPAFQPAERVEDEHRQARVEQEQRSVEDELDRLLPPDDEEGG